jgi:arylsulfatase A-like enzyme
MRSFATALLLACASGFAHAQHNVLVLLLDDVGVDKISAYAEGLECPPTPNMDALAQSGVLFRNAWSHPSSSASRAAIFTGRHPFRYGIGYLVTPTAKALPLGEFLTPELLDAGTGNAWQHAAIGKWHLGNASTGGPSSANLSGFGHFSGIMANIESGYSYYLWPKVVDGLAFDQAKWIVTDQVDDALTFIAGASEPWYCHVGLFACHAPFSGPPPELHDIDLPPPVGHPPVKPFYDATLQATDNEIGRLLAALGPELLARTTVVLTAESGSPPEATVAPFVPSHGKLSVYEGGINVPMIVSGPLVNQPGRESPHLVHVGDLFNTVLDIAGVNPVPLLPPGHKLDYISLLPYLLSPAAKAQRDAIFSEMFIGTDTPPLPPQAFRAVREAQFKLIVQGIPPHEEYYDLHADPFELDDLLAPGKPALEPLPARRYRLVKQVLESTLLN